MLRSLPLAALIFAAGCSSPVDPLAKACEGVVCGSGHCVLDGTRPACLCDVGFKADALRCVPTTVIDTCSPNPCTAPNQTTCSISSSGAVCSCNAGYVPQGSGCGVDPVVDCS